MYETIIHVGSDWYRMRAFLGRNAMEAINRARGMGDTQKALMIGITASLLEWSHSEMITERSIKQIPYPHARRLFQHIRTASEGEWAPFEGKSDYADIIGWLIHSAIIYGHDTFSADGAEYAGYEWEDVIACMSRIEDYKLVRDYNYTYIGLGYPHYEGELPARFIYEDLTIARAYNQAHEAKAKLHAPY